MSDAGAFRVLIDTAPLKLIEVIKDHSAPAPFRVLIDTAPLKLEAPHAYQGGAAPSVSLSTRPH